MKLWIPLVLIALCRCADSPGDELQTTLEGRRLMLEGEVRLHYIEHGKGEPILFIHGGLEDYTQWEDQVRECGKKYRAVAYSRRLNYPNCNASVPDYSAATDAEDAAELIRRLKLGQCHIVGFSYGGTAAMHLAIRHPDLVRTLTLCEPALIPWLNDLSIAANRQKGKCVFADYQLGLVEPSKAAFEREDVEGALRSTLDYLSGDGMYDKSEQTLKSLWKRNAGELKAILTSSKGLANVPSPGEVKQLKMPVLLLSGGRSADSCQLVVAELEMLLGIRRKEFPTATHAMWIDQPEWYRHELLKFLAGVETR